MTTLRNHNKRSPGHLAGNIENFIGYSNIPTGLIEVLVVNHKDHTSAVSIPLATTEGALVASYNRGAKAINLSGGVYSVCIDEGIQRVPLFCLKNVEDAIQFSHWILDVQSEFQLLVSTVSKHARLKKVNPIIEGNCVNLELEFFTGDAAGQNMITICAYEICTFLAAHSQLEIKQWYIEGNLAGDKKSSSQYLKSVRGKRVVADVTIPGKVVSEVLKSTPERMTKYWKRSTVNQSLSQSLGIHGHLANGLTALFLSTGQDVACVSESAVGISRFETTENGDLYACITMSNLVVGTVGGGTSLPYAQRNLDMMNCLGNGKSTPFAEIITGLLLAGELSVAAAICEKHFTSAHKRLGRSSK